MMLKTLRTSMTLLSFQLLAICAFVSHSQSSSPHQRQPPPSAPTNPVISIGKSKKSEVSEGSLRSHLGVEVCPNHRLRTFFRKKVGRMECRVV
ncbi:hypothetical protein BDM02DRAFT_3116066, partial [Thelephora ganbajun]